LALGALTLSDQLDRDERALTPPILTIRR